MAVYEIAQITDRGRPGRCVVVSAEQILQRLAILAARLLRPPSCVVLGSLRPASAPPAPPPAKPPEMRSVDAKPSPTCSPACPKNQTCCETNTCCTVTVQPAAAKHSDLLTAWPVDVLFIQ